MTPASISHDPLEAVLGLAAFRAFKAAEDAAQDEAWTAAGFALAETTPDAPDTRAKLSAKMRTVQTAMDKAADDEEHPAEFWMAAACLRDLHWAQRWIGRNDPEPSPRWTPPERVPAPAPKPDDDDDDDLPPPIAARIASLNVIPKSGWSIGDPAGPYGRGGDGLPKRRPL